MRMDFSDRVKRLRRTVCLFMAMSLLFSALPAFAADTYGAVTADKVLFRKAITGSDFWDRLDTGWVGKILSKSTVGSYTWYKVETNITVSMDLLYTGYIRGDFFRELTPEEQTAWLVSKPQPYAAIQGGTVPAPVVTATPAPGATAAPQPAAGTLTITKTSTNLRETPGGTSIWQYPIGAVLPYAGAPVFSGGYYWMKVNDTARKLSGYIRSDCYVLSGAAAATASPATPDVTSSTARVRITLGGTNLRQSPGGSVLGVLNRGQVLPYFGSPTVFGGYSWVYVYDETSKQYGYVRSDCYEFVSGAPAPVVTPAPAPVNPQPVVGSLTTLKGGTNLRNAPAGLSIAQLDRGITMTYTSYTQQAGYTWYLVNSPKGVGYVRSDVVALSQGGTVTPPTQAPQAGAQGYIVTVKSEINLRQKAIPDAAVLGQVNKAQVLPLQGPVETSNGYNWFKVTVNGQTGYIRGDCARMLSNTEVADYLNAGKLPSLSLPLANTPQPAISFVLTTIDKVYVRATASRDARTLDLIANEGTAFPLLSTLTAGGSLWYKISYKGQDGYLLGSVARMMTNEEYLDYIRNQPTPVPPAAPTPMPPLSELSSVAVTTMEKVIIRKAAGSQSAYLNILYKLGTVVALTGSTAQVGTETWYGVRFSGVNGWIRGDLLRILTKEEAAALNPGTPTDPNDPATATYRTLQLGSSGEDVTRLQQELNRRGLLNSTYVTGTYNSQTVEAVKAFQRSNSLTVDGIAGSITQHRLFNTVPPVPLEPGDGTATPTLYPVELVDWYTGDINAFWGRGETAILTDVSSRISLRIRRWAGGYHVDGEPASATDTAALCRIYGVSSAQEILEKNLYQRRAVWITLKGRTFAASLYGVPHNYPDGDKIANNNFNGQLCVHFYNSRVHTSGKVDQDHMRAIQRAYDAAPSRK